MNTPHQPTVTIVCSSCSHGNTRRVADVMAEVLAAQVVEPDRVDPARLLASDLIGFGSGVYLWQLSRELRELIRRLPTGGDGPAFLFATSGFPPAGPQRCFAEPTRLLRDKGIDVVATFDCRGWDTSVPFNAIGGIRKARPDAQDLQAARSFAERLAGSFRAS